MEEKFTIKNPTGQKIVGLINFPKANGPFPTIVIAHGFKGYKEQSHFVYLSEELSKAGFLVFRFDSTNGIGESDGDIFDITVEHYVDDLHSIYRYVLSNELVDKNNIIIYATSLGGMVALLFTTQNPKIKSLILHEPVVKPALVLPAPQVDAQKWKEQGYWIFHSVSKNKDYKVGYQYYQERRKYDMFEVAGKVKVPTLILHNPESEGLPYNDSEEILKVLPVGSKIYPLPDIPHTPKTEEQVSQIRKVITSFLSK